MAHLNGLLRVDQILINLDLEGATSGCYHHQFVDDVLIVFEQFVRQTDGAWFIVSRHAVFN